MRDPQSHSNLMSPCKRLAPFAAVQISPASSTWTIMDATRSWLLGDIGWDLHDLLHQFHVGYCVVVNSQCLKSLAVSSRARCSLCSHSTVTRHVFLMGTHFIVPFCASCSGSTRSASCFFFITMLSVPNTSDRSRWAFAQLYCEHHSAPISLDPSSRSAHLVNNASNLFCINFYSDRRLVLNQVHCVRRLVLHHLLSIHHPVHLVCSDCFSIDQGPHHIPHPRGPLTTPRPYPPKRPHVQHCS